MFTIETSARFSSYARRAACAAIAAASMTLVMASAQAEDEVPQRVVKFGDLDLSKQQATHDLYERLKRASRAVCSSLDGRSLKEVAMHSDCYETALNRAVEQVNNGALTALHEANPALRLADRRGQTQPRT
jgi:UrcA family protein